MATIENLRVQINAHLCLGDGACCEVAPKTFELLPDGNVRVLVDSADARETILKAASACRMDAIKVVDALTGQQLVPVK
jgi:ferredoxin